MDYGSALIWAVGIGAIVVLSLYGRHKWNSWRESRRANAQDKQAAKQKATTSST